LPESTPFQPGGRAGLTRRDPIRDSRKQTALPWAWGP
jgi:hypothetical protein